MVLYRHFEDLQISYTIIVSKVETIVFVCFCIGAESRLFIVNNSSTTYSGTSIRQKRIVQTRTNVYKKKERYTLICVRRCFVSLSFSVRMSVIFKNELGLRKTKKELKKKAV